MKYFKILVLMLAIGLTSCAKDLVETTGSIVGIVTDKESGEPLSNVILTLSPGGLSQVSGNDGYYEFVDLEQSQYTLQAQLSGYSYNVKTTSVTPGQVTKCDIQIEAN